MEKMLIRCTLCPRNCKVNRNIGEIGFCGQTAEIRAARAALHFWEEPVLSGKNGSGAVFFSGCNLRCVFCQNYNIALGDVGKGISDDRLTEIFFELKEKGAHNINLVTGTPYIPQIKKALEKAKSEHLDIPVIFNCGGYENVSSIKELEGLVDIYLPDMKYFSSELSARYSAAPDYFERACEALSEMFRQVGTPVIGANGLMEKGIIVRHLLLPGCTKDAKKILRYLYETYKDDIYISIMNQYTPMSHIADPAGALYGKYPELTRKVTPEEYDRVVNFAIELGIEKAFVQDGETAEESFIPAFDYEGI
ncbi:MAG: radical SAM protein [Lachnospiraceae bacterium]|nr:radical SAM protein [Lachnospiraceae bacterium]